MKKVISFFSSETLSSVLLGKEQSFRSMTVRCFHLMIFMTSYCIENDSVYFTVENPDYDRSQSHRCYDSLSIQAETMTWLKALAVVIGRKGEKIFVQHF